MRIVTRTSTERNSILLQDLDVALDYGMKCCQVDMYIGKDQNAEIYMRQRDFAIYAIGITGVPTDIVMQIKRENMTKEELEKCWLELLSRHWCKEAREQARQSIELGEAE